MTAVVITGHSTISAPCVRYAFVTSRSTGYGRVLACERLLATGVIGGARPQGANFLPPPVGSRSASRSCWVIDGERGLIGIARRHALAVLNQRFGNVDLSAYGTVEAGHQQDVCP